MKLNEATFTVTPAKPNHPGFTDNEGNVLNPGDMVVVDMDYWGLMTAVITRFTPMRAYMHQLYIPESWEGTEVYYPTVAQVAPRDSCPDSNGRLRLRRVIKAEVV